MANNIRADANYIGADTVVLRVDQLVTEIAHDGSSVRVVDNVSFDLRRGEMLGLVGESACGKSLTARSIIRLLPRVVRITGGHVLLNGEDLVATDERRMRQIRGGEIGFIFQDASSYLNPTMTIGRQIGEAARLHLGMSRKAATERAVELLGHVGIPRPHKRAKEFPHQFSGGMRQRVMIATALAGRPSVLLADEPTTALDVTVQAQIIELLQSISADFGMAVLLITHDLGIAARACERLCVMYAGRIVETGDVDDVFKHPAMPYTQGLLASVPRLDAAPGEHFQTIPGQPPRITDHPAGCRFAPRCAYRRGLCDEGEPELEPVDDNHAARCFGTGEGAWISKA